MGVLQTLILVGGALLGLFFYLLSQPNSRLRSVVLPIVGAGIAVVCGVYAISPIDLLPEMFLGPFGLIDDAGAVIGGIAAACTAVSAAKE
jgi:uncharacterized membrane protein YkvA (DUF1232 family)